MCLLAANNLPACQGRERLFLVRGKWCMEFGRKSQILLFDDDKEANELLAREHSFLEAVIAQARDGICVCHDIPEYPYVRFTVWNSAMMRTTGYTLEEINRLGWYQTLYPDPHLQARAIERMQRMREGEDLVSEEWEITSADGLKRNLRISTTVLDLDAGAPQVLALMQDFTSRKEAEEELRKSREYYRVLSRKLITAREEERRWLGRELHDDLTQRVAALAMEAGMLLHHKRSLPSALVEQLTLLYQEATKLAEDVHSLSRRVHPSVVEDFGIVEAIRSECLKLQERMNIPVRFRHRHIPEDLAIHQAVCLYRVTQETLRNIAKHAHATQVTVCLIAREHSLHLSIRDNGVGFDPSEVRKKRGLGLASMLERVSLVEGIMQVKAKPGKGAQIKVCIPLQGGNDESPSHPSGR